MPTPSTFLWDEKVVSGKNEQIIEAMEDAYWALMYAHCSCQGEHVCQRCQARAKLIGAMKLAGGSQ